MTAERVLEKLQDALDAGLRISMPCYNALEHLAAEGLLFDVYHNEVYDNLLLACDPRIQEIEWCDPNVIVVDMFRPPDKVDPSAGRHDSPAWIWYGPEGPDGDYATEVQEGWRNGEFDVFEYTGMEGYGEAVDPDEQFRRIKVTVGMGFDDLPPDIAARIAAAHGVRMIGEQGGDEELVPSLP